jgi:ferrochelatase
VHPAFVAGLIDLVLERVNDVPQEERPHLTTLGPWPDHATVGEASTVVNEATHGTAGR